MPHSIYPPEFPYRPQFVEVSGWRIAYFDVGRGHAPLLLLHGNPAAAYVYSRLISQLAPYYRCIAPDLLGFGMSDKPVDETSYSLAGHIDIVAGFVRRLDLQQVTIVGHDWGGPIGFGAAVREKQRYGSLVVLNTMTAAPMRIMPVYWLLFHVMLRWRSLYDYLVKDRGLFQRFGLAIMDPPDYAVYRRANHDASTRAAIAAFPRMIPYKADHANTPVLQHILQELVAWDIPSLVMFSDRDSVFSAAQGADFAGRLRNSRFRLVAGARHFLQYERPHVLAVEIRAFLESQRAV